ncbi:uncharacterized protein N7511_002302 [Penicillium nucicola]|uniref:uncharacterized protein n=1 Tax=Penicillium nucicola TaxID=1850975 RepID=UPI0025455E38|nr:uncharacterized protein N7511_002302 [Penicillium nucicola]KAJ5770251.1 hypothetical protein N7511_002302 [Penicillium nucicola]
MALAQRRSQVWERIIPELGSQSPYLMHLLLALGGIHMIKQKADANTPIPEDSDAMDLAVVMEHHQRGLEGFREEVSRTSPSNAEFVFAGSLILVGFAFAFLRIQDFNFQTGTTEDLCSNLANPLTNKNLRLNWLYLNRGVVSVIRDQWPVLKTGRLRQMLMSSHNDEAWAVSSFDVPSRLSRCSPRLIKFYEGAHQAIVSIRESLNAIESASDDRSSCSGTPASQPSPSTSLDVAMDVHVETIRILETFYSRITSTLQFAATENSTDKEIQLDFEEAAILSWPDLLPSAFLESLERSEHNCLHGLSLVILAHFYLINTLIDAWHLKGSFQIEILGLNALVGSLNESKLSTFMLWPNEVMNLPLNSIS